MKINSLLKLIKCNERYNYTDDLDVIGICTDSKKLTNENLFVCIKGVKFDSHNLAQNLQDKIDVFIVERYLPKVSKCQIIVSNTRNILLQLLFNFNKIDKSKIKIIGVTGTNGKTTTTHYIKYLLEKLSVKAALLGTNGGYIEDKKFESNLTTPEPFELINFIKEMIKNDVWILIMEVSAHAISQGRVNGLNFDVGIITNITQDHLDDFSSMYEYALTKYSFISKCKNKIVYLKDKYSLDYCSHNRDIITVTDNQALSAKIYFSVKNNKFNIVDHICNVNTSFYTDKNTRFNYVNLMLSICSLTSLGFNANQIVNYCKTLPKVAGRYNLINFGNKKICVDYAHTPDAIDKVLSELKKQNNDVIAVIGASGYRDSLKRKKMGQALSKYCSYVVLTADNPRYEKVEDICDDISSGIKCNYAFVKDRELAIRHAVKVANENSVIAILGKGAEETQDICAKDVLYSDIEVINRLIY